MREAKSRLEHSIFIPQTKAEKKARVEAEKPEDQEASAPSESSVKQLWMRLPGWVRNRYFLSAAAFGIWMLFLDSNSVLLHLDLYREHKRLEREIEFYRAEIERDSTRLHELDSDNAALEKFARERFWLAKPGEQIYLVESEPRESQ